MFIIWRDFSYFAVIIFCNYSPLNLINKYMKRLSFLLLPLFCILLTSFSTEESGVKFHAGKLAEVEYKAKTTNKPYILDFYTVWCGPCKNMDKYTFTNPELAKYIKENYYAFKVDGESIMGDGIEVAQKYEVRFYPTILLMSPEGNVLKRLNGFQSAEVLLQELKKYRKAEISPSTPVAEQPKTNAPTPLPQAVPGEGLFKLTVARQDRAGFGVQIGSYADYANVMKEAEKLEADFHRNVLVSITKSAEKTIFKMILGPFSTKEQAETYLSELKTKKGRSGIVVDLGKAVAPASQSATAPTTTNPLERGVAPTKKK